jgi:3-oxoacyl-[acyl-carrier protein] reductase
MFADAGADVIGISRSTHGDLSDPCTAEAAVKAVGAVDHLVINHGVWPADDVALAEMAPSQWASTIAQNLDSYFYVARAFIPKLSEGGSIVFVASTAAQRGEAFHADYAASKGAIISLTKSLAVELAPRLRVNCVAPGWVDTPMCEQPFAQGGRARIEAGIPLRRIASAADIAGPIVFLCSPLARHVTGEILNVNGGSVLCG